MGKLQFAYLALRLHYWRLKVEIQVGWYLWRMRRHWAAAEREIARFVSPDTSR